MMASLRVGESGVRRRDFRRLWITRLSAACRMRGTRYSRFIDGLQRVGVLLNRKMLSQLAIEDPSVFDKLVGLVQASSPSTPRAASSQARKPKPAQSVK